MYVSQSEPHPIESRWCQSLGTGFWVVARSMKQWFVASSNDCSQLWYDILSLSLSLSHMLSLYSYYHMHHWILLVYSFLLFEQTIWFGQVLPVPFPFEDRTRHCTVLSAPTNRSSLKSTRRPCLPWKRRTRPGSLVAAVWQLGVLRSLHAHCMLGFRYEEIWWQTIVITYLFCH